MKLFIRISVLIAVVLVGAIVHLTYRMFNLDTSLDGRDYAMALNGIARQLNRNGSYMVDEETKFEVATVSGKSFQWHMTLVAKNSGNIEPGYKAALEHKVKTETCQMQEMVVKVLAKGIQIEIFYTGNDGAPVTRVVINHADCSAAT